MADIILVVNLDVYYIFGMVLVSCMNTKQNCFQIRFISDIWFDVKQTINNNFPRLNGTFHG